MVDVVDDGRKVIAGRCGNDDLLCACGDVCGSLLLGGIEAGALQNDIDADLAPRKVLCVCFLIDGDLLAIDNDSVLGSFDSVLALAELAGESALSGIVLKKVSQHSRAGQVVDRDDLIAISLEHLSESKAADTSESVNRNFYHDFDPPENGICYVYIAIIDILLEHDSKCKNSVRTFTNSVLTQNVFRHILGMVGNTLQIVDDLDKDDAGSRVALSC